MAIAIFSVYTTDKATTHKVKTSAEVLNAQPTAPPLVATGEGSVIITRSHKRRLGILARGVYVSLIVGTGATAFRKHRFLPIFLKADYDALAVDGTITLGTDVWTIVSKQGELTR
jgi:hypothetical protein